MEVEYTLCQIQLGQTSLARRTHRREGCDPCLSIQISPQEVRWELTNLVEGPPATVRGTSRRDRLDFYFLLDNLRTQRGQFPPPTAPPNAALRLPTTNSQGTERPGGRRVRMVAPFQKYQVQSAEVFVGQNPTYRAEGDAPFLNLDMETTPPGTLYGQEQIEVHFGIQADFRIEQLATGTYNYAVVTMPPETYATIYEDIQAL